MHRHAVDGEDDRGDGDGCSGQEHEPCLDADDVKRLLAVIADPAATAFAVEAAALALADACLQVSALYICECNWLHLSDCVMISVTKKY
jgi:hypothetical protein